MKYEVMNDVCGKSYIVRCDGAGLPEMIAPARDAGQAERTVRDLNEGKATEIDALYAETGKEDSAWALVWCFVAGCGCLVGIALTALFQWLF
ncbi:MAG: hypothetical protein JXQ29_16400 [Planctomycetes bacterium]|nr:hypothetical protein [Planctomycetota bacterium]